MIRRYELCLCGRDVPAADNPAAPVTVEVIRARYDAMIARLDAARLALSAPPPAQVRQRVPARRKRVEGEITQQLTKWANQPGKTKKSNYVTAGVRFLPGGEFGKYPVSENQYLQEQGEWDE